MLINFGVKNFASFKDYMEISLLSYSKLKSNLDSIIKEDNISVLKSLALYGANASGKSNILQAIGVFRLFLLNTSRPDTIIRSNAYLPFLLSTETENKPTEYFVDFYIKDLKKIFHYEIKVLETQILYEVLKDCSGKNELVLFERKKDKITSFNKAEFKEGQNVDKLGSINPTVSFLSLSAYLNGQISNKIINFFNKIKNNSIYNDSSYSFYDTVEIENNPSYRLNIENMIKYADLGISGISASKKESAKKDSFSFDIYGVSLMHKKFNRKKEFVQNIKFNEMLESTGTHRFFYLLKQALKVLENGGVLILDEIEKELHPILVKKIIQLFNEKNNKHAQLIFSTHNTNLLNPELLRKDQICFVEKDKYGESSIYSLLDFAKEARLDVDWEKRYLAGLYGAVPLVKELKFKK